MLYYLLSGRLTHNGETPSDVLKARLSQQPIPLVSHARHVSLPTRKLVMRMIELDPEKRQKTNPKPPHLSKMSLPPKPTRSGKA